MIQTKIKLLVEDESGEFVSFGNPRRYTVQGAKNTLEKIRELERAGKNTQIVIMNYPMDKDQLMEIFSIVGVFDE